LIGRIKNQERRIANFTACLEFALRRINRQGANSVRIGIGIVQGLCFFICVHVAGSANGASDSFGSSVFVSIPGMNTKVECDTHEPGANSGEAISEQEYTEAHLEWRIIYVVECVEKILSEIPVSELKRNEAFVGCLGLVENYLFPYSPSAKNNDDEKEKNYQELPDDYLKTRIDSAIECAQKMRKEIKITGLSRDEVHEGCQGLVREALAPFRNGDESIDDQKLFDEYLKTRIVNAIKCTGRVWTDIPNIKNENDEVVVGCLGLVEDYVFPFWDDMSVEEKALFDRLRKTCIYEKYLQPKSYMQFSIGGVQSSNYSADENDELNETSLVASAYVNRKLGLDTAFFEGIIGVSNTSARSSSAESDEEDARQLETGYVFGRLSFAGLYSDKKWRKDYRPGWKVLGTRAILGFNAADARSTILGADIELGIRSNLWKLNNLAVDGSFRARHWFDLDGDDRAINTTSLYVEAPASPIEGIQFQLGVSHWDSSVSGPESGKWSSSLELGMEYSRIKPYSVRFGLSRTYRSVDINVNETSEFSASGSTEYVSQASLTVSYKFPHINYKKLKIEKDSEGINRAKHLNWPPLILQADAAATGRTYRYDE